MPVDITYFSLFAQTTFDLSLSESSPMPTIIHSKNVFEILTDIELQLLCYGIM